ncbi:MAG: hypothetical protein KDA84_14045 [Planctomycetaceae bacterium]|nr:hypothetical protein [Planctomycetaceae bacterium]
MKHHRATCENDFRISPFDGNSNTMPHTTDDCQFAATAPNSKSSFASRTTNPIINSLPRLRELSRIVDHVVASWHASNSFAEQRSWHRTAYDRPAVLTPLHDRTGEPLDVHKIISGRDISPSGFSFTHLEPLACRRAIITFAYEHENETQAAILLRLSWCRFTRAGVYQSGGKFLDVVPSPLPENQLLSELPFT